MNVENSIKFQNTIPTITAPTEAIEIEKVLFPSNVNGSIVLKNEEGAAVSKYDYTINIDFTVDQLIGTIIDCANQKNAMPLMNKMFKDGKGKIFVEVSHECGDKCTIEHISKESRPVLTVAYDPSSFATNRVYAAINLNGILPANLSSALSDMIGNDLLGVVDDLLKTLPYEDLVFSIDPTAYMAVENAKNPIVAQNSISVVSDATTNSNIDIYFEQIFNSILNIDALSGNVDVKVNDTKTYDGKFDKGTLTDANAIIKHCVFENGGKVMHIQSSNVDIEGCIIRNAADTAVSIKTEANFKSVINMKNNVIANSLTGGILFYCMDKGLTNENAADSWNTLNITGFLDIYNWKEEEGLSFLPETEGASLANIANGIVNGEIPNKKYDDLKAKVGDKKYIHFAIIKIRTCDFAAGSKYEVKKNGSTVTGLENIGYTDSKANGQENGFPIPSAAGVVMLDIDVWGYYGNDKGAVKPSDNFDKINFTKLYTELRNGR